MIEEREMCYNSNSSVIIIKKQLSSLSPNKRTNQNLSHKISFSPIPSQRSIYKDKINHKSTSDLSKLKHTNRTLLTFANDFNKIIEDMKHRNSNQLKNDEIEIKSLTNTERISNFYEYTEECTKFIL